MSDTHPIQLDETSFAAIVAAATHASYLHNMDQTSTKNCEAIWSFGDEVTSALCAAPGTSPEDLLDATIGCSDTYPIVELQCETVEEYHHALQELQQTAVVQGTPFEDALNTLNRLEKTA